MVELNIKGNLSIDESTIDEVRALNVELRGYLGMADEKIKAAKAWAKETLEPAQRNELLNLLGELAWS